MTPRILYITLICVVISMVAPGNAAFASHGHNFLDNLYDPCANTECYDPFTGELIERSSSDDEHDSEDPSIDTETNEGEESEENNIYEIHEPYF